MLDSKNKFVSEFRREIIKTKNKFSNYIFLCIGTDKIVGDSFGPLVGQSLFKINKFDVIGTVEKNLTYDNIEENLNTIYKKYEKPCIIVVDSAVSHEKNLGRIIITNRKTELGKSLEKEKFKIGDISIKAVVAKKQDTPLKNYEELINTPNKLIKKMVGVTVKGINKVL